MFKIFHFLTFLFILIISPTYAENTNKIELIESCANDSFVEHFGNQLDNFLSLPVKTKINKSEPYLWLYRDCEKLSKQNPISFNLKNNLYKEDLNEITSIVFERCADERYVLEFGDTYSYFLDLNLKEKMKQQIEYQWYVETCEEEYREFPNSFRIKYY